MTFFTIIQGASALINSGGVYTQSELYARADGIYAKKGSGFIRLGIGGATSAPRVKWAEIQNGETAIITEKYGSAPKYEGERKTARMEAAE